MATKQNKAPFKVGDKVVSKSDRSRVLTVSWVCKGNYARDEQMIATELNSYSFPASDASCYEEAPR